MTERIPGGNHGTFFIFATACALSVTAFSRASSPIGRAKGRLRRPAKRVSQRESGGAEDKLAGTRRRSCPAQRVSWREPGGAMRHQAFGVQFGGTMLEHCAAEALVIKLSCRCAYRRSREPPGGFPGPGQAPAGAAPDPSGTAGRWWSRTGQSAPFPAPAGSGCFPSG